MTWAEFTLRSHAYRRQRKNDVRLVRELAFVVYQAPHLNPKKLAKKINSFWPLDVAKADDSQKMRDRIREVQRQYKEDLKKVTNG